MKPIKFISVRDLGIKQREVSSKGLDKFMDKETEEEIKATRAERKR